MAFREHPGISAGWQSAYDELPQKVLKLLGLAMMIINGVQIDGETKGYTQYETGMWNISVCRATDNIVDGEERGERWMDR